MHPSSKCTVLLCQMLDIWNRPFKKPFQTTASTVVQCTYSVCARVCVCSMCRCCPHSSSSKSYGFRSSSPAYPRYRPSQFAHKSYAKACIVYFSMCMVLTATIQANLLADEDSHSGFIGSFILRGARSLSLYVNSSAFCSMPLWILICMWIHCVVECETLQHKRRKLFEEWMWSDRFLLFLWFPVSWRLSWSSSPVGVRWQRTNIFVV